ncbi:hypothetical protein R1sor_007268 [Riccia sorocarpa]|uniref:Uncharacterized protein n=1 Tax=Riccia sorocarpa TaxID=122646 RepID=A0ABD3HPY2_9MARC
MRYFSRAFFVAFCSLLLQIFAQRNFGSWSELSLRARQQSKEAGGNFDNRSNQIETKRLVNCLMGSNGDSKPGPVKRTIAKLRNKGTSPDVDDDQHEDHFHNKHAKTEDYAESVGYGLIREIFEYMNSSEGQVALRKILTTQAKVGTSLAVTDEARKASRVAAMSVVRGSYDAAEEKYLEMWMKLPTIVKATAVPVILFYIASLGMAMLFALWRFALFGVD